MSSEVPFESSRSSLLLFTFGKLRTRKNLIRIWSIFVSHYTPYTIYSFKCASFILSSIKRKTCLQKDSIVLPQFKGFINYLREKDGYRLISKWLKRLTFSRVKGSSWFASSGLPRRRVRKGTNKIFFTAAQNHFSHLMKLSRIVETTVKLGVGIGKFYKQKCFFKKKLLWIRNTFSFSFLLTPHPHQMQSFKFLHDSIFHIKSTTSLFITIQLKLSSGRIKEHLMTTLHISRKIKQKIRPISNFMLVTVFSSLYLYILNFSIVL